MRDKKTIIKHTILIIVVFVCFVFFQTIIQINLLDSHVINPYSVEVRAFEKCKKIRGIEVTDETKMKRPLRKSLSRFFLLTVLRMKRNF